MICSNSWQCTVVVVVAFPISSVLFVLMMIWFGLLTLCIHNHQPSHFSNKITYNEKSKQEKPYRIQLIFCISVWHLILCLCDMLNWRCVCMFDVTCNEKKKRRRKRNKKKIDCLITVGTWYRLTRVIHTP